MSSATTYRFALPGAILLVLLNGWVATLALGTLFRAENWLAHTLEVLRAADETFLQYSNANSAARAFLINADPVFAERFRNFQDSTAKSLRHMKQLTADNSSQQQRISVLRSRIP